MKKIKSIAFLVIFALAISYSPKTEAKVIGQDLWVFANGCIGTHTYHSAFFGLFQWDTYEVVAC